MEYLKNWGGLPWYAASLRDLFVTSSVEQVVSFFQNIGISWIYDDMNNLFKTYFSEILKIYKKHAFFISNTFISKSRLRLGKNLANAKQHPEAELLLFENFSHPSFTLSSINNRIYSKK